LLCSFFVKSYGQDKKVVDQILAVVGNNIVLQSSIEVQYLQFQAQGYPTDANTKCQIFEEQLYQKLLLNQARLDSVEVSDKEIEGELEARIKYYTEQFGSKEKLEEYFGKKMHEVRNELRETLKDQLITRKMQNKIAGDVKVSPAEVRKFFFEIPKDSLPMINSELEINQIVKYPKVSEYAKSEVKKKLEELREKSLKDNSFGTMAYLYSEDESSRVKNGELGFVNRGDLVPPFATAAFGLKENEISRVVETEYGYHIIQMIARKGEQINVRHILMKPKVLPSDLLGARKRLDSIIALIRVDTIKFEAAAQRYSEDEDTRNSGGRMVNPQNGTTKFEVSQIDPATNAQIKLLNVGQMSAPYEFTDEKGRKGYKVVMLKSKTKAHIASLKDDYQRIQDMALNKKKQTAIEEWLAQKQEATFIRIDNQYRKCNYVNKGWLK